MRSSKIRDTGFTAIAIGAGKSLVDVLSAVELVRGWACEPEGCPDWWTKMTSGGCWIGPALVVVGLGLLWWAQRQERTGVRFFSNRDRLNREQLGFSEELENAHEAWAILPAGHAIPALDATRRGKLKRLILCDPNEPTHIRIYAEQSGSGGDVGHTVALIKTATRRASESGCEVRWHPSPSVSVVICDPTRSRCHIRFELPLPHIPAENRPGIRVEAREETELVNNVKAMFEILWSKSIPADTAISVSAVSSASSPATDSE